MNPTDEEFRTDHTALAFFITFRTYGTWFHGDPRGSVDRFHNRYGTPKLPPSKIRMQRELELLKQPPVRLSRRQRVAAADGIREICKKRKWDLWIVNVRTNHAHSVITANCNSKKVRSALKANATKTLREKGLWQSRFSPWADKGSRKNLWTQKQLINAIVYVMYDQGEY